MPRTGGGGTPTFPILPGLVGLTLALLGVLVRRIAPAL
jgi:hypothetical protein